MNELYRVINGLMPELLMFIDDRMGAMWNWKNSVKLALDRARLAGTEQYKYFAAIVRCMEKVYEGKRPEKADVDIVNTDGNSDLASILSSFTGY